MRIQKPVQWVDRYWCYKSYPAIVVLATVNARVEYTFVDAGRAGNLGDAYAYNNSHLKSKQINGVWVQPYLGADSAFTLSQSLSISLPTSSKKTEVQWCC